VSTNPGDPLARRRSHACTVAMWTAEAGRDGSPGSREAAPWESGCRGVVEVLDHRVLASWPAGPTGLEMVGLEPPGPAWQERGPASVTCPALALQKPDNLGLSCFGVSDDQVVAGSQLGIEERVRSDRPVGDVGPGQVRAFL
jgi:hypothetical protein